MNKLFKITSSAIVIGLLSTGSSFAADKPVEIQSFIQAQKPYGTGQLKRMFMTVYDAALWTDAPSWSWDKTFALSITYHFSCEGSDLRDTSVEKIKELFPLSETEAQSYSQILTPVLPNVREGDEVTALFLPGKETKFFLNGQPRGSIKDELLSRRFFSIWLSEHTSEPSLRHDLLAGK